MARPKSEIGTIFTDESFAAGVTNANDKAAVADTAAGRANASADAADIATAAANQATLDANAAAAAANAKIVDLDSRESALNAKVTEATTQATNAANSATTATTAANTATTQATNAANSATTAAARASDAAASAASAAASKGAVQSYAEQAQQAMEATGYAKSYGTYAAANADKASLTEGQGAIVDNDETHGGMTTRYRKSGSNLVFSGYPTTGATLISGSGHTLPEAMYDQGIMTKVNPLSKGPRPFVVFVSDDGSDTDWTELWPVFSPRNLPCVVAVYNRNNCAGHLADLAAAGWEIAAHGTKNLTSMSLSAAEADVAAVKADLTNAGYRVKNYVYPNGGHNEDVRRMISRYFRSGSQVGGGVQTMPVSMFSLKRQAFGSYTAVGENTLDFYKSKVDEAKAKNGLLVWMLHPAMAEHDATQNQYLGDLLDYCVAQGVTVGTLDQALDVFGNAFEVGFGTTYTRIGNDGSVDGPDLRRVRYLPSKTATNATPITSFPEKAVSYMPVYNADNGGFPNGAGMLVTERMEAYDGFQRQLFAYYGSNRVYARVWSGSAWGVWERVDALSDRLDCALTGTDINGAAITGNTPYSAFDQQRVTISLINGATGNGAPDNSSGMLFTYGYLASGFEHQTFRKADNSGDLYYRTRNGETWRSWIRVGGRVLEKVISPGAMSTAAIPSQYESGIVTTQHVNAGTDRSGLPKVVSGVLRTDRTGRINNPNDPSYDRQVFIPYSTNERWERYATSDSAWSAWVRTDAYAFTPIRKLGVNAVVSGAPVTDYEAGAITYVQYNSSGDRSSLPGQASGELITYRVTTEAGYPRQEFRKYNSVDTYVRYWTTGGAWSGWYQITMTAV